MSTSTCRGCGASIYWIKTRSGKSMPCNLVPVHYKNKGKGTDIVVTQEGEVIRCEIIGTGNAEGFGYVPHWSTCNNPDRFRKGAKTNDNRT